MKNVNVLLMPNWAGDRITQLRVELALDWQVLLGEELFGIFEKVIFKPFTPLAEDFALCDGAGKLEYICENKQDGYLYSRMFKPARDTQGKIIVSYALALDETGVTVYGMSEATRLEDLWQYECRKGYNWFCSGGYAMEITFYDTAGGVVAVHSSGAEFPENN